MIAVLFEVVPTEGRVQQYLDLAALLLDDLNKIDGFISIERFQSIVNPAKMLSLSLFMDEEAVRQWRNTAGHRATQQQGRDGVFADYRLRVARVIRDYGMFDREQAPADSRQAHDHHELQHL